jgi:hypothetical protein
MTFSRGKDGEEDSLCLKYLFIVVLTNEVGALTNAKLLNGFNNTTEYSCYFCKTGCSL